MELQGWVASRNWQWGWGHTVVCQADLDVSPHAVQVSLWLGVVVGWAPGLLEPGVTSLHFGADLGCISRRGQQGTA